MNWNKAIEEIKHLDFGIIKKDYQDDEDSYYVIPFDNDTQLTNNLSVTIDEAIWATKDIDGLYLNDRNIRHRDFKGVYNV